MDAASATVVLIPVYNQPLRLREVVERCLTQTDSVCVIDDGSDEPVAPLLAGLAVELLRHDINRGKGEALCTAARHWHARGFTHMITLDADGQHYPEDVPLFLDAIAQDPDALFLGVRDFASARAPRSSRFGRSFGNFWVRVQTGQRVEDIQTGFRAYPLFLFENLSCIMRGYGFEVEVVVRALWGGVPVCSVPIRVYYAPADERHSHFHKLYDNARLSLLNTHLTLRAFVPWPHQAIREKPQNVTLWHPLRSIRKLLTESATPCALGLAVALGIVLGALPLIGLHTLSILIAAALLKLNRVAAVAASQLCMPPLVPALCIETGYYLRYGHFLTLKGAHTLWESSFLEMGHMGLERLWEWFLGSLIVGPSLALIVGGATTILALFIERQRRDA